ncbi:MAG: hypothetical protein JRF15_09720 [Deltaproteobacteria bacterium]|jgi:hypothetical protein|nr:hypothetical protein [Deltaproteobacteria bacterium]
MKRIQLIGLGAALSLLGAPPIGAAVIDFEDQPAANNSHSLIRYEYADMGATFFPTDDGATWDGISAAESGGWQISGSNGPTFLGFDGESYAISLLFDEPVEGFALDVARAAGAPPFYMDYFQMTGFLDGQIVESSAVYFAAVDVWQTVSLTSPVDKVVWFGIGLRGHRYGVDNLRWTSQAPQLSAVQIDVRPDSDENPIQLGSRGVVPVVLYGEVDFIVEDVDIDTLAFGPDGAFIAHRNGPHFDDIDGDGLLDMILHHRIQDTGLTAYDSEACLVGQTTDGLSFEGCDDVMPVGH